MGMSDPSLHEWYQQEEALEMNVLREFFQQGQEDANEMNVDLEGTVEDIRLNAGGEAARAYRRGFVGVRNKNNDALLDALFGEEWRDG